MGKEKLAILGCGTMGHSITLNAAWQGLHVNMYGLKIGVAERGQSGITVKLKTLVKYGMIKVEEVEIITNQISFFTSR